jgi:hypothetical protein
MGNTWFNENIGDWDVSNVRNFAQAFHSVTFSRCEISKWNVHAEGTMTHMFWGAKNFNCDLNGWDVSKGSRLHSGLLELPPDHCEHGVLVRPDPGVRQNLQVLRAPGAAPET